MTITHISTTRIFIFFRKFYKSALASMRMLNWINISQNIIATNNCSFDFISSRIFDNVIAKWAFFA